MFKFQLLTLFSLLLSSTSTLMHANLSCPALPRLSSPVNMLQVLWGKYEALFRSPRPEDGVRLLFFSSRPEKRFSVFKLVFEVKTNAVRFNQYYLAMETVFADNDYSISKFLQTTDLVEAQRTIRVGAIDLYQGYTCPTLRDFFMTYTGLTNVIPAKNAIAEAKDSSDAEIEKLLAFQIEDTFKGVDTYSETPTENQKAKGTKALSREELLSIINEPVAKDQTKPKAEGSRPPVASLPSSEKPGTNSKPAEEKKQSVSNVPKLSAEEKEIEELLNMLGDAEPETKPPAVTQKEPVTTSKAGRAVEKSVKDSNKIQNPSNNILKNSQTSIADAMSPVVKQTNSATTVNPNSSPTGQWRRGNDSPLNVVTKQRSMNFETSTDDQIEEKTHDKDSRTVRTTSTKSVDKTQANTVITGTVSSLNNNNQNLQLIQLLSNLGLLGGKPAEGASVTPTSANAFVVRGTNAESDFTSGDNLRVRNRGTVQELARTPGESLSLQAGNDPLFMRYYNRGFANNSPPNQSNVAVRGIRPVN
jgi:hypothetical protein